MSLRFGGTLRLKSLLGRLDGTCLQQEFTVGTDGVESLPALPSTPQRKQAVTAGNLDGVGRSRLNRLCMPPRKLRWTPLS